MRCFAGLVLAALLATSLAACGDAGEHADRGATAARTSAPRTAPATPANGSERTLAEQALLRLDDFPAEWDAGQGLRSSIRCRARPFRGARVLVNSAQLTQGQIGVQETIGVFPTAAAGRRAFARINARPAMSCLREEMRRRISVEAGAPASPVELMRLERLGPEVLAKRFASSAPTPYGTNTGYIDSVHFRVGRALAALVVVVGLREPDEALYERVVALSQRRLRATPF